MNNRSTNLQAIGLYLRETRQEQGLDLYDVSDRLRIRPAYLFAIEEGDLEAIPATTYALGFVRSYADCLGFDGDEVVSEVKKHLEGPGTITPAVVHQSHIKESRWPTGMAIGGSLAVACAAYGLWFAASTFENRQVANVGAWPGEVASYLSELVDRTDGSKEADPLSDNEDLSKTEPLIAAVPERPRFGEDAVAAPLLPEMLVSAELDQSPRAIFDAVIVDPTTTRETITQLLAGSVEAPTEPAPAVNYGSTDGSSRITLIAKEPSWIQVQSTDQSYRWTRILEEGERYFMPNRRDLAVWTGNAGGLEVIIDGRAIGALGQRGAVMRDVILLPEELLATAE